MKIKEIETVTPSENNLDETFEVSDDDLDADVISEDAGDDVIEVEGISPLSSAWSSLTTLISGQTSNGTTSLDQKMIVDAQEDAIDEANNVVPKDKAPETTIDSVDVSSTSTIPLMSNLSILDVVWARIGSHPWWPALICFDPDLKEWNRFKNNISNFHVQFYGENTRAWVDGKHIKVYEGFSKLEEDQKDELKDANTSKKKQRVLKAYNPSPGLKEKWLASIKGADAASSLGKDKRMENLNEVNNEIIILSRKKRKISIDNDVEIDNHPNAKKIKLEPEEVPVVPSPATDTIKGATKRQMDAFREKEEKERKEKEKGPGWYYELVPVTNPQTAPEPAPVLGQFVSGRVCLVCEEPGGQVLKCKVQEESDLTVSSL